MSGLTIRPASPCDVLEVVCAVLERVRQTAAIHAVPDLDFSIEELKKLHARLEQPHDQD